jgi:ubiquinol-cytochrome c reductase cytochrome b subunit
MQFR